MKTTHIIPIIIALFGCLMSGCVMYTSIKDEPRQSVRFSSPEAAQTFYDAYLSVASPKGRGSVVIYITLPYRHRIVSTDNVHFNSAVLLADSNHDGVISDDEARASAAKIQHHHTQENDKTTSHSP
jgi:hypothetical protein